MRVCRGKKSVTINLREPAGRELVRRLAAGADVLLENFRPGTLEKWGLAPEVLHAANPRLIVTRVSGYGQTGPYAAQPGFGAIGEAIGGIRYTTGDPETMPSRTGISIGDTLTALFATIGTLNALHARERTDRGQIVDAALYESVLAVMESLLTEYHVAGFIRERTGSFIPNIAPANAYPTRDGKVHLISGNQDTVERCLPKRQAVSFTPTPAAVIASTRARSSELRRCAILGSSTGSDADLNNRPSWPICRIHRWSSPSLHRRRSGYAASPMS